MHDPRTAEGFHRLVNRFAALLRGDLLRSIVRVEVQVITSDGVMSAVLQLEPSADVARYVSREVADPADVTVRFEDLGDLRALVNGELTLRSLMAVSRADLEGPRDLIAEALMLMRVPPVLSMDVDAAALRLVEDEAMRQAAIALRADPSRLRSFDILEPDVVRSAMRAALAEMARTCVLSGVAEDIPTARFRFAVGVDRTEVEMDLVVAGGHASVEAPTGSADLTVLIKAPATCAALIFGALDLPEAVMSGQVSFSGDMSLLASPMRRIRYYRW